MEHFRNRNPVYSPLNDLPLVRLQVAIMAACAAGFALDFFELSLGSVLSAVLSSPSHRAPAAHLAWLLAAPYLGAVFGAPLLGRVADRYGRRRTLGAVLLWLGLTSAAVGAARGFGALLVYRLLSGISLGAWPPLAIAYLTDVLPPRRRGTLILILLAVSALGPPSGIFLVRALTPLQPLGYEGWQWAFMIVALGAALCGAAFFWLPESPRWLAALGRTDAAAATARRFTDSRVVGRASAARPALIVPHRRTAMLDKVSARPPKLSPWIRYRAQLLLVATLFFLSPWSTVAFPLLSGRILQNKGLALSDTLLNLAVATLGTVGGTLLATLFIDRVERRSVVTGCAVLMAVAALVFAVVQTPAWLMVANFSFSVIAAGYMPALNIYAAELFPTAIRSFATSSTWSASRVAAVAAPVLLLQLLQAQGTLAMVEVIVASLLSTILALVVFGPPGRAGQPVD